MEPHRTFALESKTARNSDEIQKATNKDSSTNTGHSDRGNHGKSSDNKCRVKKGDRIDDNDLNLSVASRTSRDDRVFSSYNGRGSDDECSIFTSTTMTSVGKYHTLLLLIHVVHTLEDEVLFNISLFNTMGN